jgi:hypothetical protein
MIPVPRMVREGHVGSGAASAPVPSLPSARRARSAHLIAGIIAAPFPKARAQAYADAVEFLTAAVRR